MADDLFDERPRPWRLVHGVILDRNGRMVDLSQVSVRAALVIAVNRITRASLQRHLKGPGRSRTSGPPKGD